MPVAVGSPFGPPASLAPLTSSNHECQPEIRYPLAMATRGAIDDGEPEPSREGLRGQQPGDTSTQHRSVQARVQAGLGWRFIDPSRHGRTGITGPADIRGAAVITVFRRLSHHCLSAGCALVPPSSMHTSYSPHRLSSGSFLHLATIWTAPCLHS
jgi:hypothetical protein